MRPLRGAGSPISRAPNCAGSRSAASRMQEDAAKTGTASTAAQRPPIYDGWEIDEQLRHIRRVLGRRQPPGENSTSRRHSRSFALMRAMARRPRTENGPGGRRRKTNGLAPHEGACPGRPLAGRPGLDDLVAGHRRASSAALP